jgi:fucose permease
VGSNPTLSASTRAAGLLVLLSGLAFVSLGLPDGLLGVAWPSIRASFGRALDELGLLLVLATGGYVASSFASGRILRRARLGAVLAASCGLTALALAGTAAAPRWPYLLPLAAVLGLGGGAIDAALNTYAAANHGPRTLNWLHACYGVGAALGPLVMTAVLQAQEPWQRGYALVAGAQVGLALAFTATGRRWPRVAAGAAATQGARLLETLRLPAARWGIVTFVAYAGVEASFNAWTYTLLTAGRGLAPAVAGGAVSLFWGALTAGRVAAATFGARVPPRPMVNGCLLLVLAGAFGLWLDAGTAVSLGGLALAGLACGPVFPTLVALTPARVGAEHTANAVGFQIASAALGLSVVPALVGVLADARGAAAIAPLLLALAAGLVLVYRAWDER